MKFETQLTGSTPLQLCICLIPGPRFLYAYGVNLFVFNSLMWEVIVSFVAIDGIVNHYSLKAYSVFYLHVKMMF
jgi:hypothetical protein